MDVSPTGHVVLGMLAMEPRSGYDIKQLADVSTRHFWAISYGQIYPELRRLLAAGLITDQVSVEGIFPPVASSPDPGWDPRP